MPNLYEQYLAQNKPLPEVGARFNDPAFATAANTAGVLKGDYTGTALQNTAISNAYKVPTTTLPTGTTQTTPTVNASLPTGAYVSPDEQALREAMAAREATQKTASENPVLTEEQYKAQALSNMQGEIDAQNAIYAEKLGTAQKAGQQRLDVGYGNAGGLAAGRGFAGSSFGNAYTSDVYNTISGQNTDIQNAIIAERGAKISEIQSAAKTSGSAKYAAEVAAKSAGADAYINSIKERGTVNKGIAASIAAKYLSSKIDPNTDPSIDQIAKDATVDKQLIIQAYNDAKTAQTTSATALALSTSKTQAEIDKIKNDQVNLDRKFAEDKRQFGMEYALKQQDLAQKSASDGLLSVAEANAANVPYGTTKSQLMNKPVTAVDTQKSLDQIALARKSLKNATDLANASGDTSWFTGVARALGGARPIDNLTAETNTLRTNVLTMATDPSIKKFFGPQMSNADVQLMTAAGTTLNPELQSPKQMKEELLRLQDFINRAEQAVKNGGKQVVNTPATAGQVMVSGVLYNVDASGEMTPAQ